MPNLKRCFLKFCPIRQTGPQYNVGVRSTGVDPEWTPFNFIKAKRGEESTLQQAYGKRESGRVHSSPLESTMDVQCLWDLQKWTRVHSESTRVHTSPNMQQTPSIFGYEWRAKHSTLVEKLGCATILAEVLVKNLARNFFHRVG